MFLVSFARNVLIPLLLKLVFIPRLPQSITMVTRSPEPVLLLHKTTMPILGIAPTGHSSAARNGSNFINTKGLSCDIRYIDIYILKC